MTSLFQAATEERALKVHHHMSALEEADTKMIAVLKSITFSNIIIIAPDNAEVNTKEEWEYSHVKISTGENLSQNSIIDAVTYQLVNGQKSGSYRKSLSSRKKKNKVNKDVLILAERVKNCQKIVE